MSLPNGLHSLSDSSFPKSVSYEITRGNQLLRKTKRQRQRLVVPDRDPRRGSRIGATALHNHSPSRRAHSLDSSRPFKVFFQKACAFNESPCSLAICWNPFWIRGQWWGALMTNHRNVQWYSKIAPASGIGSRFVSRWLELGVGNPLIQFTVFNLFLQYSVFESCFFAKLYALA